MNQNSLGAYAAACGNADAARILPGGSADNGWRNPQVSNSRGKQVLLTRSDYGLYVGHAGMLCECLKGPPDDRPAAN
jgi:hypothetical protein